VEKNTLKRIKTLLGYQTMSVELSDDIIEEIYNTATDDFMLYSEISKRKKKSLEKIKSVWVQNYTLALSKELIGMIRCKFNEVFIPGQEPLKLNWESILENSRNEINFLRKICINNSNEIFI
jgi:hypothetical protein